jgi:asparagine N-glycosylation enzyme membrane subunit Stt3
LTAVLVAVAEIMRRRGLKTGFYVLTIAVLGGLGALLMYLVTPGTLALMLNRLQGVFGWNPGTTIMEMQPLLLQQGSFTLDALFGNFTSAVFLGLAGFVLIVYKSVRQPESGQTLLIIWSLFIFIATLAMRRFSYYFAVNLCVLSALFAWWILGLVGFGKVKSESPVKMPEPKKKAARIRESKAKRSGGGRLTVMSLTLGVALFVMAYPNFGPLPDGQRPAIDVATRPLFAPSNAWYESLDWLRQNTPEPLGDAQAYYGVYNSPGEPGGYVYPADSYGVLAWWDYGYWITRIGRRIPFSNPGTSAVRGEAKFFMAGDEASAARFIGDVNIRYAVVDDQIASYSSKFFALATWIGRSYQDYYDLYFQKQGDQYVPSILFYPAYYQTMVARLYNFDGKAVVPAEVNVIGYNEVTSNDGRKVKAVTEQKVFASYQEATQFVDSQKPGAYRIVGVNPYKSPVPLEALNNFKPIYNSSQQKTELGATLPYVKIFEYRR